MYSHRAARAALFTIIYSTIALPGLLRADVTLAWDPDSDPSTVGYRLYSGTSSGVYTQTTDAGSATAMLVSNLTPGQTYYFAVTAYTAGNTESGFSNQVSYTASGSPTPTPTPTPTPAPTPTPTPTPASTPTPTPVPTPTPSLTPAAPIATAATSTASSGFTANWNAVDNATGYRLDLSKKPSFGSSYVSGYQNRAVGNVTNFSITGLSPSTTYYYRVRAYNTSGTSGNSNTTSVTTLANPATPTPTPGSSATPTPTPSRKHHNGNVGNL